VAISLPHIAAKTNGVHTHSLKDRLRHGGASSKPGFKNSQVHSLRRANRQTESVAGSTSRAVLFGIEIDHHVQTIGVVVHRPVCG
jgi:hypothetical protein